MVILQHLTLGSQCPPFVEGKLRFYQTAYCPFAHRCRLAMVAKKIPFDPININTNVKPEWYTPPLTTIPLLYIGQDKIFVDDQPIIEYLEEAYPEIKLLPSEHKQILDEFNNKIPGNLIKSIKDTDPKYFEGLWSGYDYCESVLKDDFFGGKKPLWIDYAIWPMIERTDVVCEFKKVKTFDPARYPKLVKYIIRMKELPEVKQTTLPQKVYQNYIKLFAVGPAPYDGIPDD